MRHLTGPLIVAVFFCAIAPTLSLLQFGDPIENLNVATAMEIRRGGPWLFPTLQGEPRLAKPPLTAWLTALCLRKSTLAHLDDPDPAVRTAALAWLAFEARLPALLAMCFMLAAVYEMGRAIGSSNGGSRAGHTLGWTSAIACGTTLLFLRQCRVATTDAQLALWVTAANLFLAKLVFQRRRWLGCLGAGSALGLALMTKGPIALVQTVVPFGAFVLWRRVGSARPVSAARGFATGGHRIAKPQAERPDPRATFAPMFSGIALMVVVGLAWYASAAVHFSGARSLWLAEATRIGAEGPPSRSDWYKYPASCYLFFPWLVFLAAQAFRIFPKHGMRARRDVLDIDGRTILLPLALLVLPLFVMSFSRDRYERYMTPMIPAAAILTGAAISPCLRQSFEHRSRWMTGIVLATAAIMLVGQVFYYDRLGQSPASQSTLRPVAELIRSRYPAAELYAYRPGGRNIISVPADDLAIHLNRTVRLVPDMAHITPSQSPQVFIVYRTRRPGEPAMTPPSGWTVLTKPAAAGNEDRYVFIKDPPPLRSGGTSRAGR